MKIYVVIQIGCIECGVSSKAVAAFRTEKEAIKFDKENQWNPWAEQGGDGHQDVFEVELKPASK